MVTKYTLQELGDNITMKLARGVNSVSLRETEIADVDAIRELCRTHRLEAWHDAATHQWWFKRKRKWRNSYSRYFTEDGDWIFPGVD